MKTGKRRNPFFDYKWHYLIPLIAFAAFTGCQKIADKPSKQIDVTVTDGNSNNSSKPKKLKQKKSFIQINLVANNAEYPPARIDPLLKNAWGLAFNPTAGVPWIGAQAGHVSTVYNSEGLQARAPVNIPSPGGPIGGNPTGVVFSASTTDFVLPAPNNQPARFLFVGVDGILSGWNGAAGNNAVLIRNFVATSAFTGLALASNGGANFLYAANFRARRIDVFDRLFNIVPMPFMDPGIPSGYSPFNIQKVDDMLFVTYAKVGVDGRSEEGLGKGYVDIFSTNGTFIKRLASNGPLDAPWGVAKAPATLFNDDEDEDGKAIYLIGNFENGHITAYRSDGKLVGELAKHDKTPIVIDGLWAITFPPSTAVPAIEPNRLYFTAGPDEEADGLFGYIKREPDDD